MKDGNFKVRCLVGNYNFYRGSLYTKGKVYDVVNGKLTRDDGSVTNGMFYSIYQINAYLSARFELVKEPDPNTIVIFRKDNNVIASLKEGKETIRTEKARCCPDDKFDFNTGAKIAFDRLLGIDSKASENSIKIVKQDTYKVGDKVKLVSKRPSSWGSYMDEYLGKVVDITQVCGGCFEFAGGRNWTFMINSIEGKIQENDYDLSKVSDEDLIAEITKRVNKK